MQLTVFVEDHIWTKDYPVAMALCGFDARMSIIRLQDGQLMLHSPCEIDHETAAEISKLGRVAWIVAPGSFHHLHVASTQRRFPGAQTYICPGLERKVPRLHFDWILGPSSPPAWSDTIEQVVVRGNRYMCEVAMLHRPSRTLVLVDSIEFFNDHTTGVDWRLRAWWKLFRMWNKPGPAPEYRFGWKDRSAARDSFETILQWDFDRILISHGENILSDAKEVARTAWTPPLARVGADVRSASSPPCANPSHNLHRDQSREKEHQETGDR